MNSFEEALKACVASNLRIQGFSDSEKNILTVLNCYESTDGDMFISKAIEICQDKLDKNLSSKVLKR